MPGACVVFATGILIDEQVAVVQKLNLLLLLLLSTEALLYARPSSQPPLCDLVIQIDHVTTGVRHRVLHSDVLLVQLADDLVTRRNNGFSARWLRSSTLCRRQLSASSWMQWAALHRRDHRICC